MESGLTLIHQQMSVTPVVVADVWVDAGAASEPAHSPGIAHFLEHMIFKGTDRLAPGVFDQTLECRGGVSNAVTSHDYAHYFIATASPHLPDVFPQFADLLFNATIPDTEFERERDVIFEEIRQAYDNPEWVGFQSTLAQLYPRHAYGRSILGNETALLTCSPQAMRQFHRNHYHPQNMALVFVGDLTYSDALALASRNFQPSTHPVDWPNPSCTYDPPLAGIQREVLVVPELDQACMILGWRGPGVASLKTAYCLDMLASLLASGRTSILVQTLREERDLVECISSDFSLQRDSSLFTITAWMNPENLDRVEAIIADTLTQVATVPILEADLRRCQRFLCNDYAFSTETPAQLAGLYGYYSVLGHIEAANAYPAIIQSLTAEDLCQAAQEYLSPYHYAITIMQPQ
jgi:zinc protease